MMLTEPAFDPTFLEYWLKTATRGLCAEACVSIRAEIESRYARLYEESRISGQPGEQAAAQAFRALGDLETARRRFARTHLLEHEAMVVARIPVQPTRRTRIWTLVECVLPLPVLWYVLSLRDMPGKWIMLPILAFLIVFKWLIAIPVFRLWPLQPATRLLLVCLDAVYYSGALSIVFLSDKRGPMSPLEIVSLMAAVTLIILFFYGCIWLKLRRKPLS